MRQVTDEQRRRRLARRHALAPGSRVGTPEEAVRAMTALHATEPATVYLSLAARVPGLRREDVDRALYTERSLVRQLAMRRTLFVLPRDLLPATWGSASARTAGTEERRLVKDAELAGLGADGTAWLQDARRRVLEHLEAREEGVRAVEVGPLLPELASRVEVSAGSSWNHTRVLTHLGATADAVRGPNTSHWRVLRPRWTLMSRWLGDVPEAWAPAAGYAELVRRWLATFGPGTTEDLVWWLGATKTIVRTALVDVGAVEVGLEGGGAGWLLPDDLDGLDDPDDPDDPDAPADPADPAAGGGAGVEPEPWAALLPVLDPTVMGWKERGWYLGEHAAALFDRNGNAGTTAWWQGRVVGCWVQDAAGAVVVHPLEDLPDAARAALEVEATRLSRWLDGERVGTVYPSPAMKAAIHDLAGDHR